MPYSPSAAGAVSWADVAFSDLQSLASSWFHAGLSTEEIRKLNVRFHLSVVVGGPGRGSGNSTRLASIVSDVDWKELQRNSCLTIHVIGTSVGRAARLAGA